MNQHSPIRPEEPTFGCVLLAALDADDIAFDLRVASVRMPATEAELQVYSDRVRTAQLRLGTLAGRLGYDLVPASATEAVDA